MNSTNKDKLPIVLLGYFHQQVTIIANAFSPIQICQVANERNSLTILCPVTQEKSDTVLRDFEIK